MLFGVLLQLASDPLYRNISLMYLHRSLSMVTSHGAAIWALAYGGFG
jgi:hypothetical protein